MDFVWNLGWWERIKPKTWKSYENESGPIGWLSISFIRIDNSDPSCMFQIADHS